MATYDLSQGMPASISEGDILYCPYAAHITTPFELPLSDGIYTILCKGAKGGDGQISPSSINSGGAGGCVKGTLYLTGNHTLYLYPGSAGISNNTSNVGGGGWNGGGAASPAIGQQGAPFAGGGGGAADVRLDGTNLSDRIIVAGGGGGGGAFNDTYGGAGGGYDGFDGSQSYGGQIYDHRGFGGTQTAGGGYGGIPGYGGTNTTWTQVRYPAPGGGGGYYGGGAANPNTAPCMSGGGGGSGYADSSLTSVVMYAAPPVYSDDGYIQITVDSLSPTPPTPTQFPFRIKVNGVWKNVDHGYVCENGVYKPIKKVFYKTGGVWKNA